MSRSHIHNTDAPSTPINPFAPASPRPRDSGIGAIGKLLSTPYDTNDESDADDAITPKLHSDTKQPVDRSGPRVSQVASAVVQSIKSPEGDVHVHADHQHGAYGRQPVSLPFPNVQHNQDYGSYTYTQSSNNIAPTSGLGLSSSDIAIIHLSATFHSQSLPVSSHHALSFSQPQHLRSPRSLPLPLKRITPPSLLLPRRTHLQIALPLPPSLQPPDISWPTHEPHLHPNP